MEKEKQKYTNEKNVELYQIWTNYENEEVEQRKKMRNFLESLKHFDMTRTYYKVDVGQDELFLIKKNCETKQEELYYVAELKKGYDVFLTGFVLDYFEKIKTEDIKNFFKKFQQKSIEEYFYRNKK